MTRTIDIQTDLDSILKRLHLANARRVWRDLIQRAEKEQWPHGQLLQTLFQEEVAHRRGTRLTRAVRTAAFPFLRTVEEFDFTYQSTLRLTTIGSLLAPDFVTEGRSAILLGKPGRGKTHLAIAHLLAILPAPTTRSNPEKRGIPPRSARSSFGTLRGDDVPQVRFAERDHLPQALLLGDDRAIPRLRDLRARRRPSEGTVGQAAVLRRRDRRRDRAQRDRTAALPAARLQPRQEGQKARRLQENATRRSKPHEQHATRTQPCSSSPQRRYSSTSRTTKRGRPPCSSARSRNAGQWRSTVR